MYYPILIHKDEDSDYGVIIPDLPGCFSAGSTYEEALSNAKEAIECHLEGLLLDGDSVPISATIDQYVNDPEYADGIWALIEIDLSQISGKAKRINITLPEKILALIDLYTRNHALRNRSAFIVDATLNYMTQKAKRHRQYATKVRS